MLSDNSSINTINRDVCDLYTDSKIVPTHFESSLSEKLVQPCATVNGEQQSVLCYVHCCLQATDALALGLLQFLQLLADTT